MLAARTTQRRPLLYVSSFVPVDWRTRRWNAVPPANNQAQIQSLLSISKRSPHQAMYIKTMKNEKVRSNQEVGPNKIFICSLCAYYSLFQVRRRPNGHYPLCYLWDYIELLLSIILTLLVISSTVLHIVSMVFFNNMIVSI